MIVCPMIVCPMMADPMVPTHKNGSVAQAQVLLFGLNLRNTRRTQRKPSA
jgi:hypothetical protein